MTIYEAYNKFSLTLTEHGRIDAPDEARVLICHLLKIDSAEFFAASNRELSSEEQFKLEQLLRRRMGGEPAAYIMNCKEFFGFELFVDGRVLVPRPETEVLVEEALKIGRSFGQRHITIADIGTGSGAIAVALALNLPSASIYAIDISPGSLEVARLNINRYGMEDRITLLQGDLLGPLPQPVDMIVGNLPYIPEAQVPSLQVEISEYEPRLALEGGCEGTELIERLLGQVRSHINENGVILLEFGIHQENVILNIVKKYLPGSEVSFKDDLAGIKRIINILI